MISRRTLWALLPLFILGCSDNSTTVQPPAPLTPDEQTVANVRTIRDALETYASAHGGSFGTMYSTSDNMDLPRMGNVYTGENEPELNRAAYPGQIGVEWFTCDPDGKIAGYRITGYGRDRILITLENLSNVAPDVVSTHDATVANAYLVLNAARRFAAANDGVFSTDVAGDQNKDGNTLQDLLPNNGDLLINPFTAVRTEPQDGLGLAIAGAVGYLGGDGGSGYIDTFTIEAYSCTGDYMLYLVPYTTYGEMIWDGSYRLRAAVETFAKASGHYPRDLDKETTPSGKTVLDLISDMTDGHVPYFINYYNQDHYVPTVGIATGKFTIGYQPIETAGVVTDYVITGRVIDEIVRLGPKPLN